MKIGKRTHQSWNVCLLLFHFELKKKNTLLPLVVQRDTQPEALLSSLL